MNDQEPDISTRLHHAADGLEVPASLLDRVRTSAEQQTTAIRIRGARSRWLMPAAAAAAVIVLTTGVLVAVNSGRDTDPATTGVDQPVGWTSDPLPKEAAGPGAFAAIGEQVAALIQNSDEVGLIALQRAGYRQPQLTRELLALYGGRRLTPRRYVDSGFYSIPYASVDYLVSCSDTASIEITLRYGHYDGQWYLFPLKQQEIGANATPITLPPNAADLGTEDGPAFDAGMRYPMC